MTRDSQALREAAEQISKLTDFVTRMKTQIHDNGKPCVFQIDGSTIGEAYVDDFFPALMSGITACRELADLRESAGKGFEEWHTEKIRVLMEKMLGNPKQDVYACLKDISQLAFHAGHAQGVADAGAILTENKNNVVTKE